MKTTLRAGQKVSQADAPDEQAVPVSFFSVLIIVTPSPDELRGKQAQAAPTTTGKCDRLSMPLSMSTPSLPVSPSPIPAQYDGSDPNYPPSVADICLTYVVPRQLPEEMDKATPQPQTNVRSVYLPISRTSADSLSFSRGCILHHRCATAQGVHSFAQTHLQISCPCLTPVPGRVISQLSILTSPLCRGISPSITGRFLEAKVGGTRLRRCALIKEGIRRSVGVNIWGRAQQFKLLQDLG